MLGGGVLPEAPGIPEAVALEEQRGAYAPV